MKSEPDDSSDMGPGKKRGIMNDSTRVQLLCSAKLRKALKPVTDFKPCRIGNQRISRKCDVNWVPKDLGPPPPIEMPLRRPRLLQTITQIRRVK